ncbi:MAG TPA: hypothetical protein VN915_04760 [Elusimicrobiota bacterium]|nr:hypothetical protein [Elusimicrobiota bacterium]
MKAELFLAALLLATIASLSAPAAARERPDAAELLVAALSSPATGYEAQGRIQSFAPGRKPRALGMTVYFLPDGRLRREVRASPRKPAEQVYIEDGGRRELYWPALATAWKGTVTHESAADRAARLLALYSVSVSTGGRVVKRATWRLDLRGPDGVLRRAYWVDRAEGLLLKCEEYRPDGSLLRRERLTALGAARPDQGLFRLDLPPDTPVASLTAPRGAAVPGAGFPRWIPDGFLALESRTEDSGRSYVVGYGDGVETFELRQTLGAKPDGGETSGRTVRLKNGGRGVLGREADGSRLTFQAGGRAYAISGEIPEDEMMRVADSLATP